MSPYFILLFHEKPKVQWVSYFISVDHSVLVVLMAVIWYCLFKHWRRASFSGSFQVVNGLKTGWLFFTFFKIIITVWFPIIKQTGCACKLKWLDDSQSLQDEPVTELATSEAGKEGKKVQRTASPSESLVLQPSGSVGTYLRGIRALFFSVFGHGCRFHQNLN